MQVGVAFLREDRTLCAGTVTHVDGFAPQGRSGCSALRFPSLELLSGQFLVLGGKTRALLDGRAHVTFDDIRAMAAPVLRHRILVNYRAEAEGVTVDQVIEKLFETVSEKASAKA